MIEDNNMNIKKSNHQCQSCDHPIYSKQQCNLICSWDFNKKFGKSLRRSCKYKEKCHKIHVNKIEDVIGHKIRYKKKGVYSSVMIEHIGIIKSIDSGLGDPFDPEDEYPYDDELDDYFLFIENYLHRKFESNFNHNNFEKCGCIERICLKYHTVYFE